MAQKFSYKVFTEYIKYVGTTVLRYTGTILMLCVLFCYKQSKYFLTNWIPLSTKLFLQMF